MGKKVAGGGNVEHEHKRGEKRRGKTTVSSRDHKTENCRKRSGRRTLKEIQSTKETCSKSWRR